MATQDKIKYKKALELCKKQRNEFMSRLIKVDKEYNYNYTWALDSRIDKILGDEEQSDYENK